MNWFNEIDGEILLKIQGLFSNEVSIGFFKFITHLGDSGMIWIVIALFLLVFRKTRSIGVVMAASLIFCFVINNLALKNIFARTRPYEVLEGLNRLVAKESDYSFPSGHSGSSFAGAFGVYFAFRFQYLKELFNHSRKGGGNFDSKGEASEHRICENKGGVSAVSGDNIFFWKCFRVFSYILIILATLISFSRWVVGVHYPSDVIAGAVIGILSAYFCAKIWQRKYRSKD